MRALVHEFRRQFKVKECLHPLASPQTCGKVISAHTIQRATALKSIADHTGHVLRFDPQQPEGPTLPRRVGSREASTFAGFCARHDNETFAPLEQSRFVASDEQCFLLAYRAQCHEFYQKQASERAHIPLSEHLDRGETPETQLAIQTYLAVQTAGVRKGLAEARENKLRMDAELLEHRFTNWTRFFVYFRSPLSVVSTGVPTPNRDLSGRKLQVLHNPKDRIQPLYLSIVPVDGGGVVTLMWRPGDLAPARFVADLEELSHDQLASTIVQFVFAYVENTYFSSAWWSSLSGKMQSHISNLARMGNPYYEDWEYLHESIVPWRIERVTYTPER